MATASENNYYVPSSSHWPIVASVSIFLTFVGAANMLNGADSGKYIAYVGLAAMIYMVFGWFGDVIDESCQGKYNAQVDRSFRISMMWFILSEVMFFAAFFGALFYVRVFSVPWLAGVGDKIATHEFLWSAFEGGWPLIALPDSFGFSEALKGMGAWGLPALNTAILLTSGATITYAHWGLKKNSRSQLIIGLALTVLLGAIFVYFQMEEYGHAFHELNLTLNAGVYGATFFMLTGFHGFHVSLGTLMLAVVLLRSMKGHFSEHNHFAFEAVAWYWHFVDVVWLGLFIFVYWL